ncbi:hypothetical protein [Iodobacter sp.]|uniref:hypothetical protein n=1 Tax=Iodobacter sp. TaxID=1915058 RepID=UPI0025D258E5|nr:hypothetical protein [Iodobacter sp.]
MLSNPLFIKLFVAISLFACGLGLGGAIAYDIASQRAKLEKLQVQESTLLDRLNIARQAMMQRLAMQARSEKVALELDQTRNQLAETRISLNRSIARVTTVYKTSPASSPQPLPACVFTAGFVRSWNSALASPANYPSASAPSSAADQAQTSHSLDDDLAASPIQQADLLSNHIDNSLRCQGIEAQLNQLIDWHRE